MAHQDMDHHLGSMESRFNDYIIHGDDFMKIQIYRRAKEFYTYALETNFNNALAGTKLSECNALIKSESRIIIAIVSIMAILAVIIFLGV